MAEIISSSDFESKVMKSESPVLVDFFASWCGPCQMMSPVLDELSKEVDGKAKVFKVDVEKSSDLANQYNVMSIPTMFVFNDGKVTKQFNGVTTKDELKKALI